MRLKFSIISLYHSIQVPLLNIEKILELVLIHINENKDLIAEKIEKEL